jgi:gliding motility-associated-like protein
MKSTLSCFHKLLPTVLFCISLYSANAQFLQVTGGNTPPYTPQNLISNVFLGNGVDVTNITYNGTPIAVGYFTGGTQSIGLDRGIILTTGRAETSGMNYGCSEDGSRFADNQNGITTTDPDLAAQTSGALNDLSEYIITFVPTSDTLRFRYCFGSEEYPEYSCSLFNDVFGFFIQGPGYPTPTNIALIPGTNLPVTINNLHPSNGFACPATNAQYYHNNDNSNKQPVYDGYTSVFTAQAIVVPCQQYTIKLAIADVTDHRYDSGVFLEAKSFGTGSLKVAVATPTADNTITEGCVQGNLTFSLPNPTTLNFPLDYHIWGTATNGVDYQNIPGNLFIPAGQNKIDVPIIALDDHIAEGSEFIAVDYKRDICHRDTVYIYIRDNGLLPPHLRPDTTICTGGQPLQLDATLPIALPVPPTFTNSQVYNIPTLAAPLLAPINVFGVQPTTLAPNVIRSVCLDITHNWDDDLYMYLLSPGGQILELSTHNGGNGHNYTNTCFTPTASTKINFPGPFAPSSAAPFTGNWLPQGPWTDLYGNPSNGAWKLSVVDKANGFPGTLNNWSITFEPSYKVNYKWSPATGLDCPTCPIANASPTQNTTYTVIATDSYGCTVADTVSIAVNPALLAPAVSCGTITSNTITFNWTPVPGASSYEVNVNGTGWVPASGFTSHLVTGLAQSAMVTIQVRGIDSNLTCAANIGTASCTTCDAPVVTNTTVPAHCFGTNTGSLTIIPDGVNPPYTYKLGAASNATGIFTNLASGTYTVTVTDVSGCSIATPVIVPSPPALAPVATTQQDVTCFGSTNGSTIVAAAGGTGALSYKWSDPAGQTTVSAVNLAAGTYTVTVTDANGCTGKSSATITQPPVLTVSTASVAVKCFGDATGSATATGGGGVSPYQYAWNNMASGPANANIPAGGYTVTVTDANGCQKAAFTTVVQPPVLSATTSVVNAGCQGGSDGTATVSPAGGTAGPGGVYTYKWNTLPQQTTKTATGLKAQTYTVTVTDANGCTVSQMAVVTEPPVLTVALAKTDAGCKNNKDGTATATSTGGTAPVVFKWSDPAGQTTATANGLGAGTYTVTATDAHNCTTTATIAISEPQALQITDVTTNVSCFGLSDGKIVLKAAGGSTPYTYIWNSGEITSTISGKPAGPYAATVTDGHGCTAVFQKTITEASQIKFSATATAEPCFGFATASINTTVSGGAPGYTYAWKGPNGYTSTKGNPTDLFAGQYNATVTDNNGCTNTVSALVDQPAAPVFVVLPTISDSICFQASNGTATVVTTGGTLPYAYSWSTTGQNGPTAGGLVAGTYTVTVTDANGCSQSTQTIVAQKGELIAFAGFENPHCHDGTDGTARLTSVFYSAIPANPNKFNYTWSTNPVQHKAVASGLHALGTYSVTITDNSGCSATQTVTLGNPALFEPAVLNVQGVKCPGDANGSAAVKGVGGAKPYKYFWSPGPLVRTDSVATGLSAGKYRVTITDANGCAKDTSVIIGTPPDLKAHLQETDVLCFGGSDGKVTVTASGGIPPYQYTWDNGAQTAAVSGRAAGQAAVTVTDINGCIFATNIQVGQPANPVSGTTVEVDPKCFGGRTGKITIQATGGTPPYLYGLDNGTLNGSSIQIGLGAGTYIPRIVDHNGCETKLTPAQIIQPAQLKVELGPNFSILLGRDTQLIANVSNAQGAVRYTWAFRDSTWLSCLNCADPFVDSLTHEHIFSIRVTDAAGCVADDQIQISVDKPRRIFVPTGFTPNGDGENDRLLVHGQSTAKVLVFRVYDRWGEMVFEMENTKVNDPNEGWDGAFRGKELIPGVYVWVLEVQYIDGVREILKGDTTLIR